MDWTALSVLTAVVVGAVGYLARDTHRQMARLEGRMEAGFAAVERRFEQVDRRFEQVDRRFEQVDRRFEQLETHFDTRFDSLEERYIRHLEAHATH